MRIHRYKGQTFVVGRRCWDAAVRVETVVGCCSTPSSARRVQGEDHRGAGSRGPEGPVGASDHKSFVSRFWSIGSAGAQHDRAPLFPVMLTGSTLTNDGSATPPSRSAAAREIGGVALEGPTSKTRRDVRPCQHRDGGRRCRRYSTDRQCDPPTIDRSRQLRVLLHGSRTPR